jgi:hypothetical protein
LEVAMALPTLRQALDVKAFFEFLVMIVPTLVWLTWGISDFAVMGIEALIWIVVAEILNWVGAMEVGIKYFQSYWLANDFPNDIV